MKTIFSFDCRAIAFFRMCLALLLIADITDRLLHLDVFLGPKSTLPLSAIAHRFQGTWLSVYSYSDALWAHALILSVALICAILLLFRIQPWPMMFLSWVLLISVHDRNSMILYGGDALFRLMLFWALMLPISRKWKSNDGKQHVSWATVGYTFQICFIYWVGGVHKWNGGWMQGDSVHYALNLDLFASSWGIWIRQYTFLMKPLAYLTYFFEVFGPFLLFVPRLRTLGILGFMFMHFNFGLFMALGLFPYYSIVCWIPFLPKSFWDRLLMVNTKWEETYSPITHNVVAITTLVLVTSYNLTAVMPGVIPKNFSTNILARKMRLSQDWNMFANPMKINGWYVCRGKCVDGTEVNLFTSEKNLNWAKPDPLYKNFTTVRLRKMALNLLRGPFKKNRIHFARHLAYKWNCSHPPTEQVVSVDIYSMQQRIPELGKPASKDIKPILLQHYAVK